MPTNQTSQPYPWDEPIISPAAKMVATFSFIGILLCIALPVLFSWVITALTTLTENPLGSLLSIALGILILAGCGWAVARIWRYASRPTDQHLRPSYTSPDVVGKSFIGQFIHVHTNRTFNGSGLIRFEPEHLVMNGRLEPGIAFQLLIIFVVTVIPLVLFGIGLGLIPALILAAYLGKKEEAGYSIPYSRINQITVQGRTIRLTCDDISFPHKSKFRVAPGDGERLYRELQQHHPSAVMAWEHLWLTSPTTSSPTEQNQ